MSRNLIIPFSCINKFGYKMFNLNCNSFMMCWDTARLHFPVIGHHVVSNRAAL